MTDNTTIQRKSAARSAFEHYLRTGERLTPDQWIDSVGCKFNPYHEPRNGQFTFAPSRVDHATRGQRLRNQSTRKRVPMSQRDVEAHAEHAMDQYHRELARGKTLEAAAAWAANSEAESGGDPSMHQRDVGPGRGMYQWGSTVLALDRSATFQRVMKMPVDKATTDQQLDFRDWELRHTHISAQRHIDAAQTVADKSRAITKYYLGPKDVHGASENRARIAEAIYRRAKGTR